jgi:peptide/nickel transport system substrate-binding protein
MNTEQDQTGCRADVTVGRLFVFAVALFIVVLTIAFGTAGCGSIGSTSTSGTSTTAGQGAIKPGGVMSIATDAGKTRDPHFASARSDILINEQVYDRLVEIDANNHLQPGLATSWDSEDGKTWTFTLRAGVKFSDGTALTAADVVYSFDRLRDPKVGSPVVSLYKSIASVTAVDPTHVQFVLSSATPEFPSNTADYHAAILSKAVADPKTMSLGSGPFVLASYAPEDRAILKKNPLYWGTDPQGRQLPYLDELDFVFFPDQPGQVNALLGGQAQFAGGLTAELAASVKGNSQLTLLTTQVAGFYYVLHMRSDAGRPTADARVRQALQLGTDHAGLISQVNPTLAVPGNGTPVGPAYSAYYLDQPAKYDPVQAKQLLTQAGHATGLIITLYAQNALEAPAIATVWKAQMAQIGVTVNIQTEPVDVYYGDGDTSWLKCDFGITEWAYRATPVDYFNVAYITGGAFNESHWSDPEFDVLTQQINGESDAAKRAQLYRQAQTIFMERGPVIVPFFEKAAAGISAKLAGIALAPDWSRTSFRLAHFTG